MPKVSRSERGKIGRSSRSSRSSRSGIKEPGGRRQRAGWATCAARTRNSFENRVDESPRLGAFSDACSPGSWILAPDSFLPLLELLVLLGLLELLLEHLNQFLIAVEEIEGDKGHRF